MPTPIDLILDPISLIFFSLYVAMMILERLAPGRDLPKVSGWIARGLTAFVLLFLVSSYLPMFWTDLLATYQVFDFTGLPLAAGILVGILSYELVAYVYHRSLHGSDTLWRFIHQMHHSAERLDTYGAFYFSPLDMVGWTAVGSLGLVLLVGLDPKAATYALLTVNFLGIFQHTNIRTPHWLGYIIQRPESHTIHHGYNIHRFNYADVPLWDMIFGTFRNPQTYEVTTGFFDGASRQVGKMIMGKDISRQGPGDDA